MQLFAFLITDIIDTKDKSITVKTVTGNERRLPRSQAIFYLGKVYIPMWLAETMARDFKKEEYFA